MESIRSPRRRRLSPHLDDGVLSLGAAMAGGRARALASSSSPSSRATPTPPLRRAAGTRAPGTRPRASRPARGGGGPPRVRAPRSDAGLAPVRERRLRAARHRRARCARRSSRPSASADDVLLPGFPLSHPDHAWLGGLLEGRSRPEPGRRATRSSRTRGGTRWRARSFAGVGWLCRRLAKWRALASTAPAASSSAWRGASARAAHGRSARSSSPGTADPPA